MPIVVRRPHLYAQPPAGFIRPNRAHYAASDLQYFFVPQFGLLRNAVGSNEILAPATSAAKFQPSIAGWSATSDATNSRFALASPPRVDALTRDITMMWHGVFHGAAGGSNIVLFGQTSGTGASAPFTVAALSRAGTGNQDQLGVFSNNGSNAFINWNLNCGLSSHYGRRVTFIASQVAGAGGLDAVFVTPTSTTVFSNAANAQSGLSGNPRNSSASDVFLLGGYPSDTARHPNASAALAVAWSRALTLEQMTALALSPWDVVEPVRSVVAFQLASTPQGEATAIPAAGTSTVSAVGASTAASTATPANGTSTVSAVGASNAATTATPAAGTSTVSAVGSTAPGAGSADAVVAAGTSTVSAVGASRAATSAVVAAGTSTVSAIGAARAAATATPAAGTSTVSAVGSTAVFIAAGDAVPASGTATVSAAGSATGTISATPIPAAGVATVQGSTGVLVRLTKPQLKLRFADYVTPTAQDFSNLIDSYADYSATLTSWAGIGSGTGVLRVLSNVSVTVMPFASLAVSLTGAANTAQATAILGASTLGQIIFTAPTTSQALSSLGGGAVGQQVFAASTTSQFTSLLGPGLTAATQAEVSARTVTDKYVPPGNMNPHPGLAKAWCWMSVTAGVVTLRGAHNITEVSAIATGRYRFFMSSPMATSAYAVIATHSGEYTEENTNIGYGYAGNPRFKKPGNFDVFFGRPITGPNTSPTAMNDGEFYVSAYGWV